MYGLQGWKGGRRDDDDENRFRHFEWKRRGEEDGREMNLPEKRFQISLPARAHTLELAVSRKVEEAGSITGKLLFPPLQPSAVSLIPLSSLSIQLACEG